MKIVVEYEFEDNKFKNVPAEVAYESILEDYENDRVIDGLKNVKIYKTE